MHPGSGPADVTIRFRYKADEPLREDSVSGSGTVLQLRLWNIDFAVAEGREINVAAFRSTEAVDVRIYLLGSIMAVALHQRAYLPLHANVVRTEGGTAAFCGDAGAGKSTLAAWFEKRGHNVLADDLCGVRFEPGGRPLTFEGVPRMKLWADGVKRFGRDPAKLERVASDMDKYHVPLIRAVEQGSLDPIPLDRVYLLDRAGEGEGPAIQRLTGAMAAEAVLANAFRWELGQRISDSDRRQFDQCVAIAKRSAVFRALRRWSLDHFEEDARMIERHLMAPLQELAGRTNPELNPDAL